MRLSRSGLTIRGMMVVVAIIGMICMGVRESRTRLNRQRKSPIRGSALEATVLSYPPHPSLAQVRGFSLEAPPTGPIAGRPFPVRISYNFRFDNPKPPPGTSCLLYAMIWFVDDRTGDVVISYAFDAGLQVGGRETASGTLNWKAVVLQPGSYRLHFQLMYQGPEDEQGTEDDFKYVLGGGSGAFVVEAAPSPDLPPTGPGRNP